MKGSKRYGKSFREITVEKHVSSYPTKSGTDPKVSRRTAKYPGKRYMTFSCPHSASNQSICFSSIASIERGEGIKHVVYVVYIFQRVSNRFCCWDERPSQREGMAPMDARYEQILTHARMPSCISRMSHAACCVFVFVEVLASGCYVWGGVCNVLSFF